MAHDLPSWHTAVSRKNWEGSELVKEMDTLECAITLVAV